MNAKTFVWNLLKAETNRSKHQIEFIDAVRLFDQPHLIERSDRNDEERWIALGFVDGLPTAIAFTDRGDERRLISARPARKDERKRLQALPRG